MTGSRSSSCDAMKLSTGRVVLEEKDIKRDGNNIQKIYKEEILI